METMFSVGSAPRLYNEDPRPAEEYLRKPLETAVEDGNELVELQVCGCEKKTSRVLQLK
jgi:hypothetical protein